MKDTVLVCVCVCVCARVCVCVCRGLVVCTSQYYVLCTVQCALVHKYMHGKYDIISRQTIDLECVL